STVIARTTNTSMAIQLSRNDKPSQIVCPLVREKDLQITEAFRLLGVDAVGLAESLRFRGAAGPQQAPKFLQRLKVRRLRKLRGHDGDHDNRKRGDRKRSPPADQRQQAGAHRGSEQYAD